MLKSHPPIGRLFVCLLAIIGSAFARPAVAQRAVPDPAPLNNFNPLCDSSLVHCLEIDPFAGHVYGHLQVLPKTDRRDTAAVFPFGVTLGLFGRIAGGISTYYAFWKEGDAMLQQLGPLRLNLTGRLLPIFSAGKSAAGGDSHETPRGFQLGLTYEHEVRIGPFSGSNSLGLLTDLASLHLTFGKWLGPFQLSASMGALFDWRGSFVSGSLAGQFGWRIPGFEQLKVHVQGMARGIPAYVKPELSQVMAAGPDLIHPQGIVGGGLAFRAHRRVDLSAELNHGLGAGIAPWAVGVNLLVISGGKEHEGRAVTPLARLAVDATVEMAKSIQAYIQSLPIDPYLDERCILRDENGEPMMDQPAGIRTADGRHCLVQGEKLAMHAHWLRDKKKSVVCHDKKLTDCLMYRRPGAQVYRVLHRPWVGEDCVLRENVYDPALPTPDHTRAVELLVLGAKTRAGCTDSTGHVHAVGTQYYREHGHLWVCDTPRIEEQRDHCFLALAELPHQMKNQVTPGGRIARALDRGLTHKAESIDRIPGQVVGTAEDVAESRITIDTVTGALQDKAEEIAKHATVEDAKRWINGKLDGIKRWAAKPTIEQGEDLAESMGDSMIPHPVAVGATLLTGGVGRGMVGAVEELEDAATVGKKARKAAARAARNAEEGAEIAEADVAHTIPAWAPKTGRYVPAPKSLNAFPDAWKVAPKTPVQGGGGKLRARWMDKDKNIYEWDYRHGTVEKYNKQGKHLGEFHAETGQQLKGADPTRDVKK